MKTLYLDHAATTPLDERVLEAMLPFMTENYGNANSAHHLGQKAKVVVEDAREKVAQLINADPSEIIFTSGGTESDNAVIKGVMAVAGNKNELITSHLEHHAVLHPIEMAKMNGFKPVFVEPEECGRITAKRVENVVTENTALVSLMHVNNEIGTITDIVAIGELTRSKGIVFHVDAAQSAGKIALQMDKFKVDL
ncbi:MAG: aminotransferase class V-fold PLP-dependent enzyme, partial [Balneolales bacterium]|nr:aminotransferase class V-fold PLP-dependent enzyme [Balneolales bacterium]